MSNRLPFRALLALILSAALLGACSTPSGDGYPSLAKRPIEGTLSTRPPEPQPEPPPLPADATLAEQIARHQSDAARGEAAFRAALGTAQSRTRSASGASTGSEAWIAAQMAISAADAARGPTVTALASLDKLQTAQINSGSNQGVLELNDALASVTALAHTQDDALHALNTSLRQP